MDSDRGFAETVHPMRRDLLTAALRLTGSPDDAQDLVQETVLRAWRHWSSFDPGSNVRGWLHTILRNAFISGYRRRRREREILEIVRHEPAAEPAVESYGPTHAPIAVSNEVRCALDTLSPDFRTVVALVDLQGRSYQDAARIVGCPVGTVMSRLHRARHALSRRLRTYAQNEGYLAAA